MVGETLVVDGFDVLTSSNLTGIKNSPKVVNITNTSSIGKTCFKEWTSIEELNLGEGLITIGYQAFSLCSSLSRVSFPSSLKSIKGMAFNDCPALTSVRLPPLLEEIGESVFLGCKGMEAISVGENVNFRVENGVLFSSDMRVLICVPPKLTETPEYVVPNEVEELECGAFGYTGFSRVVLHEGITKIGNRCFYESKLASIDVPSNVTTIMAHTFFHCMELTHVSLPPCVKEIGMYAFGSTKITQIELPSSLVTLGMGAFNRCSSLETIHFPDSLESIGEGIFMTCTSLKSITLSGNNKNFTLSQGILFTSDMKTLIAGPAKLSSGPSSYEVPNTVTKILTSAFSSNNYLVNITIPESVQSIGTYAFSSSSKLENVIFKANVTKLTDLVFAWCKKLKTISLPDWIESLGDSSLTYCQSLTHLRLPSSLKEIQTNALFGCFSLASISTLSKNFKLIDGVLFSLDNKLVFFPPKLKIDSQMYVVPNTTRALGIGSFAFASSIKILKVQEGLKIIENEAFSNSEIQSVILPSSLESIGKSAFYKSKELKCIYYLGKETPKIGNNAFAELSFVPKVCVTQDYNGTLFDSFETNLLDKCNPCVYFNPTNPFSRIKYMGNGLFIAQIFIT